MMKKESFFFTLLLLVFVLVILFHTLSFDAKTKLVPFLIGAGSLLLGLAVLMGERFPRFQKLFEVDLFRTKGAFETREFQAKWTERKGFLIIILWLVLFASLIFFLGFLIAVPTCVLLFIKLCGNQSWSKSLIVTAAVWIFVYGLFEVLMGFELFEGVIFGGIF